MALTMADADRMIRAAIAKAEEFNAKLGVAVCATLVDGSWPTTE